MSPATSKKVAQAQLLEMFVLDVLRHDDIEQLSSILSLLNNDGCIGWREFWPHEFTADEVVSALGEVIDRGFVEAAREVAGSDQAVEVPRGELNLERDAQVLWYHLTPAGLERWNSWEPPVSESDSSPS